jgi:hypothetical protein
MPIGLNVNNPQEENPEASVPISTANSFTFGGNALGSGASTSTTGEPDFSTILLYGAIGLAAVWILKRVEGN